MDRINNHGARLFRLQYQRGVPGSHPDAKGKWKSGRINFINAETGEEIKGNNKGSNLLIFIPGYSGPCITRHVSKGDLLIKGMAALGAESFSA